MFRFDGEVFLLGTAIAAPSTQLASIKIATICASSYAGKPAAAAGSSRTAAPIADKREVASQAAASAVSLTKGFVRRSWPKVDIGPWPGTKAVSSPIGQSL